MRGDRALSRRLARTYSHGVSAFRPLPEGGEETVCRGAPCALSRAAQVASPAPPDVSNALPESAYRLSLYTAPGRGFALGDRLEITDGARVWHAIASDSFPYPSHTVTVAEVREVLAAETQL